MTLNKHQKDFTAVAQIMTNMMSEACKSLVIEKFNLVHCKNCTHYRRTEGVHPSRGCECPESPFNGYTTWNEAACELFENFSCVCGQAGEDTEGRV